jgi:hypothetical protein
MSNHVANEIRKILHEFETTRLQPDQTAVRVRLLALAERIESAGLAPAEATTERPKKTLVLHIAVPGFYADDLDDYAGNYTDGDPRPEDRLYVVTEEWMRSEVGITLVSLPGEKCSSDDFEVHAYTGRIVGAELAEGNQP